MSREEYLEERFLLVSERIGEIGKETVLPENLNAYFQKTAEFLNYVLELHKKIKNGWLKKASLEALRENNQHLYQDILPDAYETSFANPAWAVKVLGNEYGKLLSFLEAEIRGMIVFAYEDRIFDMTVVMELFVQIYNLLEEPDRSAEEIKEALYWYVSDYSEEMVTRRIREAVDPDMNFAVKIICQEDLFDLRYLYQFGEYITENEEKMAAYLNGLSQEEIDAMARTFTEGYRIGFLVGRKDISKKKTVNIRFQNGFERMVKAAVKQFQDMGLAPVIYRSAVHAVNRKGQNRIGYYGAIPNRQYDYDHREDAALFLNQEFIQRKLRVMQVAYEQVKELANVHGGPAVIETFGERSFSPLNKKEAFSLNGYQQKLQVSYNNEAGQIVNRYIKGEERSFTIIAYPVCEIGDQFEAIFRDTVRLNNLDYHQYQEIQQIIIQALDEGESVTIKGQDKNRTDLTVALHRLENPKKQTNFENCVADVNIPVGEVFTSPRLTGTNGVLHVTGVYLNGLYYKDLELTFENGKIKEYSCRNFESLEENRKYIEENILFHHASLPIGEFAIGTNTTAYVMGKKYKIEAILPILIAEKTGPHFAVGDTCYSWAEETPVYNPDGKEIIARDNEISILRKEDPGKAYFGCHTDITIPYEEIALIEAVRPDGRGIPIIENGRFVLPGTEELNKVLDETG
ncbi:MAG: aminopeptidase [Firmicutes bacterium]|nr:aminopeptidase [Bacillota bacterium]MDY3715462.1 aminopeptidase [Blautia sp.]